MHRPILILALLLSALGAAAQSDTRGIGVEAPDGETPVGEQYLFAIAVNRYEHWNPLSGPVPEAEKLVKLLTSHYAFAPDHTIFLKDRQATRAAIARQFAAYKERLEPADSLLVLFCGHGYLDPDSGSGYWIPVDAGVDRFEQEKWLHNSTLRGYLKNIPARHILVIADSCFSGQLLEGTRTRQEEITDEYYRRAYQRMARQVMTSGGIEEVADASAFGDALYNELLANREPYIDPAKLFVNVRAAVRKQQPLLGTLKDAGHQQGGSFIFFRRQRPVENTTAPPPTLVPGPEIRDTGTIDLVCRLAGVLFVDGRQLGRVEAGKRYTLQDILVGERRLRIVGADGDWQQAVLVMRDRTSRVEAQPPARPGKALEGMVAVGDADFAPLDGLAAGSREAQARQRDYVRETALPLEAKTAKTGIVFRLVPPGEFVMGSPRGEDGRDNDETQHRVKLTKGFYVGKYEVTQGQWQAVMGENPSHFQQAGKDAPVEQVSWEACQEFCRKLCRLEGVPEGTYVLLTEAQWEYACRAGTSTALINGDLTSTRGRCRRLDAVGWYDENSGRTTHRVGQKLPNGFGLYDMHGNVWEWCDDWYDEDYPAGPVTDPRGPGAGSDRVYRGGSWIGYARYCRAANRLRHSPGFRYSRLGLRLARPVHR